jgi:hypothetical protein
MDQPCNKRNGSHKQGLPTLFRVSDGRDEVASTHATLFKVSQGNYLAQKKKDA